MSALDRRGAFDPSLKEAIKNSVTMFEVLDILGWEVPGSSHKIRSIYNTEDRTPSLHIYDYSYYDYSTGQGGDQIRFVMDTQGCTFGKALQILGRRCSSAVRVRDLPEKAPEGSEDFTKTFDDAARGDHDARLMADRLVLANWPHLDLGTIEAMGVKVLDTSLWIPHYDKHGAVRGIKIRSLPSGSKYSVSGSFFGSQLYRPSPLYFGRAKWDGCGDTVVLVEGESDCWSATVALEDNPKVDVLALPSGAGYWRNTFTYELLGYDTVYICLDDDDAGHKATAKIKDRLNETTSFTGSLGVLHPPGGRTSEAVGDGWPVL